MSGRIICILVLSAMMLTPGCRPQPESKNADISKLNAKITQNFRDAQAHYELAQIYQQQGNWDKAAYEYDISLKIDPVNRDAQASMLKVLLLANDRQRADQVAKDFLKQVSYLPEDSIALGRAFEVNGIDDYALKAYEQAVRIAPKSPVGYKQLGFYYLAKKERESAKTYFLRSFQMDPYQPDVAQELGRLGIKVKVPAPVEPKPAATAAKNAK